MNKLIDGTENDILYGTPNHDNFIGGPGFDPLYGGQDNDPLSVDN